MAEEEASFVNEPQTPIVVQPMNPPDTNEGELDEKDWEASVQLANALSGLAEEDDDDSNNQYNNNIQGASSSNEEVDSILKLELDGLSQDEEELLGKAAREAVRKYEEEMRQKRTAKLALPSSWEEDAARQKAESKADSSGSSSIDYSEMTVTELKDLLRERGLKVSGKKGELIERLSGDS
jgi:hypothetical protein